MGVGIVHIFMRNALNNIGTRPWSDAQTYGAIGERAQLILVWVRAPRYWERLLPTEIKNQEDKAMINE